jgi:hypothetical protein
MALTIEPRLRYVDGSPAWQGDKVRTTDSREDCYLRVIGQRGYVTVFHPSWPAARVYHVTEIEPRS